MMATYFTTIFYECLPHNGIINVMVAPRALRAQRNGYRTESMTSTAHECQGVSEHFCVGLHVFFYVNSHPAWIKPMRPFLRP